MVKQIKTWVRNPGKILEIELMGPQTKKFKSTHTFVCILASTHHPFIDCFMIVLARKRF
jgi:hypothetical protein